MKIEVGNFKLIGDWGLRIEDCEIAKGRYQIIVKIVVKTCVKIEMAMN
jgi:hypothetical protein